MKRSDFVDDLYRRSGMEPPRRQRGTPTLALLALVAISALLGVAAQEWRVRSWGVDQETFFRSVREFNERATAEAQRPPAAPSRPAYNAPVSAPAAPGAPEAPAPAQEVASPPPPVLATPIPAEYQPPTDAGTRVGGSWEPAPTVEVYQMAAPQPEPTPYPQQYSPPTTGGTRVGGGWGTP